MRSLTIKEEKLVLDIELPEGYDSRDVRDYKVTENEDNTGFEVVVHLQKPVERIEVTITPSRLRPVSECDFSAVKTHASDALAFAQFQSLTLQRMRREDRLCRFQDWK